MSVSFVPQQQAVTYAAPMSYAQAGQPMTYTSPQGAVPVNTPGGVTYTSGGGPGVTYAAMPTHTPAGVAYTAGAQQHIAQQGVSIVSAGARIQQLESENAIMQEAAQAKDAEGASLSQRVADLERTVNDAMVQIAQKDSIIQEMERQMSQSLNNVVAAAHGVTYAQAPVAVNTPGGVTYTAGSAPVTYAAPQAVATPGGVTYTAGAAPGGMTYAAPGVQQGVVYGAAQGGPVTYVQ